jgi:hypothetical protein
MLAIRQASLPCRVMPYQVINLLSMPRWLSFYIFAKITNILIFLELVHSLIPSAQAKPTFSGFTRYGCLRVCSVREPSGM